MEMDCGQSRPLAPRLGPPPLPNAPPDESKKRKRASVACKPCRERKIACNTVRPTCAACEARRTECYYLTKDESETKLQALRRENRNLNDLLEHLRTEPDDVAQSILQQLRGSVNPLSILENIENGSLSTVQPSKREAALAALPIVHSETEFRLMVDHSTAYPALDLSRDAILAKTTLLESAKILASDLPSSLTPPGVAISTSKVPILPSSGSHALDDDPEEILNAQGGPNVETDGTSLHFIDPLLRGLKITFWTTVPVTDHFATSAISLYLENDHPVLGLFDAQLFMTDLVGLRQEFCSSFLVSSLLAFACQAYTAKDPEAAAKSVEFEKEAELLWRAEKRDSILTVAGLMLLYLSHGGHASQREGEFVQEASDMAKRLNLFGVKTVLGEEQIKSLSHGAQRALSHTAWGVFNLYILQAQYYLTIPTEYDPKVPIPQRPGTSGPCDEVEGVMQSGLLYSHETGRVFRHLCKLSVIASQILLVIRDTSGSKTPPSLAFALSQYRQLLELMDNLPEEMKRKSGADSASVLDFHIAFHSLTMDLFRPFITRERDDGFRQFFQQHNSPEAIFASSVHQLKGIILEYTSQHPCAAHHLYWHTSLLYVFNAIVKDRSDPYWRFYFCLCIHCYSKLYICYAVTEGIVQSLLAIAVKYGAISKKEATRIMQARFYGEGKINRERGRRESPKSKQRVTYMMDLDLAVRDREAAGVGALMAKFEDMNMFTEFTRMGESESSEDGNDVYIEA